LPVLALKVSHLWEPMLQENWGSCHSGDRGSCSICWCDWDCSGHCSGPVNTSKLFSRKALVLLWVGISPELCYHLGQGTGLSPLTHYVHDTAHKFCLNHTKDGNLTISDGSQGHLHTIRCSTWDS
jgi:hypothetical protein